MQIQSMPFLFPLKKNIYNHSNNLLYDFDDDAIIEEMERRGLSMYGEGGDELINKIYHARRQGQPYDHLLDQFLYEKTGRVL